MGRAGCGVPRVCRCKQTPGGSGNPPSATTSGRNKRVHARLRRAMELADGEAHLLHPARDRANNRRGGAPRGEHPRWGARRLASACGRTSLARRRVPLHPSACRRSAPLICDEGQYANLGGQMPRENDDACAEVVARVEPLARLRASSTRYGETRKRPVEPIGQPPDFTSLDPGYGFSPTTGSGSPPR